MSRRRNRARPQEQRLNPLPSDQALKPGMKLREWVAAAPNRYLTRAEYLTWQMGFYTATLEPLLRKVEALHEAVTELLMAASEDKLPDPLHVATILEQLHPEAATPTPAAPEAPR